MGGSGSGRHRYSSKDNTSAYRKLDVRLLQRHGSLFEGWRGLPLAIGVLATGDTPRYP
jgi:hypothetical protein